MMLPMFAQEDKPERSQDMMNLELVSNLARYGYDNNSASVVSIASMLEQIVSDSA